MLNIQEIANFLNSELNAIGAVAETKYKFNIMAEVGKHKNDNSINGVIRNVGGDIVPRAGFVGAEYNFIVELSIACGNSNFNLINIENIINSLIVSKNATEQEFTGGKGVITLKMANPKEFNIAYGVGDTVPLVFSIKVIYTESGVVGADKHWLLDGEEIPFLTEGVNVQKDGKTVRINTEEYTKTLPTGQTKFYKFTMKYDGGNSVCQKLQKDIMSSDFAKTYKLKFYDGVNYTETEPFETVVSLFNSGNADGDSINIGALSVTFTDADDGLTAIRYFLALIDFPFINENTRYFNSIAEQTAYFDAKINAGADFDQIKAPNIDSLTITSQVYPNTRGYGLIDLLNKNYAVIEERAYTQTDGVWNEQYTVNNRLYYKITKPTTSADGQIIVDLALDSVQTVFFNSGLEFSDCFIEKAHLNRFIDNEDGTVSFDGGVESQLFEREDVQGVAKRLTRRKTIGVVVDPINKDLNAWLDKYIAGWNYYYLTRTGTGKFKLWNGTALVDKEINVLDYGLAENVYGVEGVPFGTNDDKLTGVMPIICTPVWKIPYLAGVRLKFVDYNGNYIDISHRGLEGFVKNNGGYSLVYARKFSKVPPFLTGNYSGRYTIKEELRPLQSGSSFAVVDTELQIGVAGQGTAGKYGYAPYAVAEATASGEGVIVAPDRLAKDLGLEDYYCTRMLTFGKTQDIWQELDKFWLPLKVSTTAPLLPESVTEDIEVYRPDATLYKKIRLEIYHHYDGNTHQTLIKLNNTIGTEAVTDYGLRIRVRKNHIALTVPYFKDSLPIEYRKKNYIWGIVPHILQGTEDNPTSKNPVFNPKLLGADYSSLRLTNERGNGFDYDIQKLNQQRIETLYTEPPTPDISRSYFRATNTDGVYIDKCDENLTGLVDSADMSLMVDNTQLAQTLAENKNFFLQAGLNSAGSFALGAITTGVAGAGKAGVPGAIVGGALGAISNVISSALSTDNMKHAPNMIKNANGSAYFNAQYSAIGPTIEEYDILPNEKEIVNDYMFKYGFNYNKFGQIRDYVHTRKYFNFIKAQLDIMKGIPLSNTIRDDLRSRFEEGIRFWHSDNVQYKYENYELWLEAEYTLPITVNATGVTGAVDNPTEILPSESATLSFTANAGYNLPSTVTVTGADYTWNASTGILVISNATTSVVVNIAGEVQVFTVTTTLNHAVADASNPSTVEYGETYEFVFTPENGYMLIADNITVTGATYQITQATSSMVRMTIQATSNVTISVEGVAEVECLAFRTGANAPADIAFTATGNPTDNLLYSTDGGVNWTLYTLGDTITLGVNSEILWKGTINHTAFDYITFTATGTIYASGNIMSIIDNGRCTSLTVPAYAFYKLFDGCSNLITPPELPATTLGVRCYAEMFRNATNLSEAPALPATILAEGCYETMFAATAITEMPELPATTPAFSCYQLMFTECMGLTSAKINITSLAGDNALTSLRSMFSLCLNLQEVEVAFSEWVDADPSWLTPTDYWLGNVSATGTFKCPSALPDERSTSRIPQGWTIERI